MNEFTASALPVDMMAVNRIYDAAVTRYMAEREQRLPAFIDTHFSLKGSLRLHRKAIGGDLARAPANMALAVPNVLLMLAALIARKIGCPGLSDNLSRRQLLLTTAVAAEVEWLIYTELLELPISQALPGGGGRSSARDALAETLMQDPRVADALERAEHLLNAARQDPEQAARVQEILRTYADSRSAASEIVSGLTTAGVGAATFHQLTPGALSLGPMVAAALAQNMAVASFPLGSGLGALWYGVFPAAPPFAVVAGATFGMMAAAAILAAFAGIAADPMQRLTGLHKSRLRKLLKSLEGTLRGENSRLHLRDHYIARLWDVADILRVIARATS